MLMVNQKCKLAVVAKSAKWVQKTFSSFPLNKKFSELSGLSGLSRIVPNYASNILLGLDIFLNVQGARCQLAL